MNGRFANRPYDYFVNNIRRNLFVSEQYSANIAFLSFANGFQDIFAILIEFFQADA